MRADQARTIPIDKYLETQGIQPDKVRQGGRELWYKSPLRQDDSTPSFKVDVILNAWYDHGLGRGGNTLDLAIELQRSSVSDALAHLERTRLFVPLSSPERPGAVSVRKSDRQVSLPSPAQTSPADEKEKTAFELLEQKPLEHPALLQYLQKRSIDPKTAGEYVSQIDFKQPQSDARYFALGYPAGDGFEARSALFKGFVGIGKNITFHDLPGSDRLLVFEGFMDFLSYLTAKKFTEAPGSVLVLNSTALKARALPYLNDPRFSRVELFLDNDASGDETTAFFRANVEHSDAVEDMRDRYAGYDDLNAWLIKHQR